MNLFINQIKEKIKNKIKFEEIKITDNTDAHRSHKSFQKNKLHLTLEIQSEFLGKMNRVDAERLIMKVLKDDLRIKFMLLKYD